MQVKMTFSGQLSGDRREITIFLYGGKKTDNDDLDECESLKM